MIRYLPHSSLTQKKGRPTESGPTPIFAVRRIAQELLNESGRYQTTLKFNTGQVTSRIHLDSPGESGTITDTNTLPLAAGSELSRLPPNAGRHFFQPHTGTSSKT
ncbi:hypothetical protein ES703_85427 [subsurface metagenome]